MRRFKLPKLRHPWAKSAAGFTLVELIVVIAIMGVLAGVGTVGYSGYVKNAKKKADINTVANIKRALDVGASSMVFDLKNANQAASAGVEFPVGFVLLTQNGIQSMESASATNDQPCNIVTTDESYNIFKDNWEQEGNRWCAAGKVCQYEANPVTYCETCYPKATWTKYVDNTSYEYYTTLDEATYRNLSSSDSRVIEKDNWSGGSIYKLGDMGGTTHKQGEVLSTYKGGAFIPSKDDSGSNTSFLVPLLQAAYGSDYDKVALQYDGWNSSSTASFYTGANAMWDTVNTLATNMVGILNDDGLIGSLVEAFGGNITQDEHSSATELMTSTADVITSTHTSPELFYQNAWKPQDDSGSDSEIVLSDGPTPFYEAWGFGFGGREYYSACRIAYNEAFGAYLSANGHSQHAERVREFGDPILTMTFPKSVCLSSLDPESTLDDTSGIECATCTSLYKKYISSGTSRENAYAFYNTMVTVDETAHLATGGNDDDFFTFYEGYLTEFAGMYNEINNMVGTEESYILITVFQKEGKLRYEISPLDADPAAK